MILQVGLARIALETWGERLFPILTNLLTGLVVNVGFTVQQTLSFHFSWKTYVSPITITSI